MLSLRDTKPDDPTGLIENNRQASLYTVSYDSGALHITLNSEKTAGGNQTNAMLVSSAGKVVGSRTLTAPTEKGNVANWPIGPLSPGIYILRLEDGQGYQQASKFRVP